MKKMQMETSQVSGRPKKSGLAPVNLESLNIISSEISDTSSEEDISDEFHDSDDHDSEFSVARSPISPSPQPARSHPRTQDGKYSASTSGKRGAEESEDRSNKRPRPEFPNLNNTSRDRAVPKADEEWIKVIRNYLKDCKYSLEDDLADLQFEPMQQVVSKNLTRNDDPMPHLAIVSREAHFNIRHYTEVAKHTVYILKLSVYAIDRTRALHSTYQIVRKPFTRAAAKEPFLGWHFDQPDGQGLIAKALGNAPATDDTNCFLSLKTPTSTAQPAQGTKVVETADPEDKLHAIKDAPDQSTETDKTNTGMAASSSFKSQCAKNASEPVETTKAPNIMTGMITQLWDREMPCKHVSRQHSHTAVDTKRASPPPNATLHFTIPAMGLSSCATIPRGINTEHIPSRKQDLSPSNIIDLTTEPEHSSPSKPPTLPYTTAVLTKVAEMIASYCQSTKSSSTQTTSPTTTHTVSTQLPCEPPPAAPRTNPTPAAHSPQCTDPSHAPFKSSHRLSMAAIKSHAKWWREEKLKLARSRYEAAVANKVEEEESWLKMEDRAIFVCVVLEALEGLRGVVPNV